MTANWHPTCHLQGISPDCCGRGAVRCHCLCRGGDTLLVLSLCGTSAQRLQLNSLCAASTMCLPMVDCLSCAAIESIHCFNNSRSTPRLCSIMR